MHFRNLGKSILYRMCRELTLGNCRGALESEVVYRTYADIPRENVEAAIESLLDQGWVEEDKDRKHLRLTPRGISQIRSWMPSKLLPKCKPPPTSWTT